MVRVYDSVFTSAACSALHAAASSRGLGHAIFERATSSKTPLEVAVDSYLRAMDDAAPFVEYWSRQEWKHIEAHADVDEKLAAATGSEELRYPQNGHVLYLNVGPCVRGPTCIWTPASDGSSRFGSMTTVPAVNGRVLRFDGSLQHAVPRPADIWLAPFVINKRGDATDFCRSVVLFNTWHEPPQGVEPVDGDEEEPATAETAELVRCAERKLWVEAPEHTPDGAKPTAKMKLWLLGDVGRRGQVERTIPLPVDGDLVLAAMEETVQCTHIEALS